MDCICIQLLVDNALTNLTLVNHPTKSTLKRVALGVYVWLNLLVCQGGRGSCRGHSDGRRGDCGGLCQHTPSGRWGSSWRGGNWPAHSHRTWWHCGRRPARTLPAPTALYVRTCQWRGERKAKANKSTTPRTTLFSIHTSQQRTLSKPRAYILYAQSLHKSIRIYIWL